jgi:hypothetical protein
MRTDGTARNLYIPSPRDKVVAVYDSDTYIMPFFKVIANAFSILCVFFGGFYICILYVHNLPFISIFQYRSDIHVLDRTQASFFSALMLSSMYLLVIQQLKTH